MPAARAIVGPDHLAEELEQVVALDRDDVPAELVQRPVLVDLLRMALSDWAVIGIGWAGMVLSPWWLYPVWALLVCSRLHAFGVVLHDVAHQPLRGKPMLVRVIEVLCGYPIATTLEAMRYHHLRHHRDSGMASDPYFKEGVDRSWVLYGLNVLRGILLVPFWTVRPWFGMASLVFPGLRHAYGRVFLQDKSGRDLTDSREVERCARAELGQALFQLGVFAFAVVQPWLFVWGYLVPVTLSGLLAAWRVLLEHRYVRVEDRKLGTILATTCDHHLHPAWRWLFAPRNIGYHVVHHLHPQVGLRSLPALRTWYQQHHADYPAPR